MKQHQCRALRSPDAVMKIKLVQCRDGVH
jgi:hypothetical protein